MVMARLLDAFRARMPRGLVDNARFLFLAFTLAAMAVVAGQLLFVSGLDSTVEIIALPVIGALVWRWVQWHRTGKTHALDVALEAATIISMTAALGNPLAAVGVLYLMVLYRALFSSVRAVALGMPLTVGAFLYSVEAASHPDYAITDPVFLLRAPFFPVVGLFGVMFSHVLRRSEAAQRKYEALVEQAGDAIFLRDRYGTILEVNQRACTSLGYSRDELVGRTIFDIEVGIDAEELRRNLRERHDTEHFTLEGRQQRKDGTTFPVEIRTGPIDLGDETVFMAIVRDVTEQEEFERQLTYQAFHDDLTNLPNRALFEERLIHALKRLERNPGRLAVMFLDLDNFKIVNDSLDHHHGDDMLRIVGRRLSKAVRPGDTVARMGGDEFTILLEDIDGAGEALTIAERIEEVMREEIEVGGYAFSIGASIGVAIHTEPGTSSQELIRRADVAMYEAKSRGKGGTVLYDGNLRREVRERIDMELSLSGALEREELTLHYQPVIDLVTHEVREVEALLRWMHPTRGLLTADAFLELAEESGTIRQINTWMLHRACAQMAEWKRTDDVFNDVVISVNVSEHLLRDPRLVNIVSRTLRETRLHPESLKLEIDEKIILNDVSQAADSLHALHDLGVKLAVDNFGSINSTFNYLRQVPFDSFKIEQSFVEGFHPSSREAQMLAGLARFAEIMGLTITANGVSGEQYDHLSAHGCHLGQGKRFGEPVSPERLVGTIQQAESDTPEQHANESRPS